MLALSVRCFVAQVAPGQDPAKVTERLEADKRVESAQVMQLFHGIGHNDPFYPLQSAARLLRLDELHRVATGKHVSVALIDTGIDLLHPDLKGQVSKAENFVDGTTYVAELHGTAVAGVIVAKADNGIGIVGIAPSASIMSLRACWQNTQDSLGALCDSFTIGKAIQFALAHQANIIHFSLAGPHDRLLERLGLPDLLVKALLASMQSIRPIVDRHPVISAIQSKASSGDAVGIAADGGA